MVCHLKLTKHYLNHKLSNFAEASQDKPLGKLRYFFKSFNLKSLLLSVWFAKRSLVESMGLEPTTSCMPCKRSTVELRPQTTPPARTILLGWQAQDKTHITRTALDYQFCIISTTAMRSIFAKSFLIFTFAFGKYF